MPSHLPLPLGDPGNGEYRPAPPDRDQRRVAALTAELAQAAARPHGISRRRFLHSASGLAIAFLAMNQVYGEVFEVDPAEAADPAQGRRRAAALADQFIFDVQLHYLHDRYRMTNLLDLRQYAGQHWNPSLKGEPRSMDRLNFANFLEEVFLQSDTKIGLLSGAPADKKENWFLSNDELARARRVVEKWAGSRRLLCHAVITPGQPGWREELSREADRLRPDSWKGYTVGDPISPSRYPYRLDDQKLMYPAYQKMVEAGITTFCIHKGLVPDDPADYPAWQHAKVDEVGQAARDWPQINFVIYHSALQPITDYPQAHLERFEKSGRINWVSDLAEIPARYGVSNVYAEIGTAFASSCLSHPRHAAALLGILIKGMGPDKVLWGTDSVWYGSPQWQIEALRRIEIPADLRQRYGFAPLGGPDSAVKRAILGRNAASLYGLQSPAKGKRPLWHNDRLASLKDAYQKDPAIAKAAILEADRKRRDSRP